MVLNLNEENGDSNNVIDDNLPEMLLDCEDDVVEDDNLPGILLDRMYIACLRSEVNIFCIVVYFSCICTVIDMSGSGALP